jgi:hypothetical protein
MNSKGVAAVGAALAVAFSGTPVAASCIAVPAKDHTPENGVRTGLAQPAPNHLWVSGTVTLNDSSTHPYIERFDPVTGWSRSIFSSMGQSAFNSIGAFSPAQAIAVGFTDGGATALAVMFDGSRWFDTLGSSGNKRFRGSLQKIAVVPTTATAYAVLAYGTANLLYWDGSMWSAVVDVLPLGGVFAVGASSPNDVWAVGGRTDRYGIVRGLVERYHDGRWTELKPPAKLTMLTGVEVRQPNDVWVSGLTQQGSSFGPYVAHWDGSVWQQIALPLQNSPTAVYGDIYVQSERNIWISASDRHHGETHSSLWHWNGQDWLFVAGSTGWTEAPLLGGYPDNVWFTAGTYRRTRFDGNRWLGMIACDRRGG